jgi:protein O-mannosyl-transferase
VSRRELWTALGLAAATLAAFEGAARCGFVAFDDEEYVTHNPMVGAGLSWRGLAWAATTFHATNWHPLTWLSHMLDVSLFGTSAAGPHLVSLLWHAASAVLFFLALSRATRELWPAALAAALFALHPLRVESVVWIAERKDVLCTFLYLLAVTLYGRSARRGALVAHALALLAKPMAVTLPLALLVVDFWPLRRPLDRNAVRDKLPFAALSAASCAVTLVAQLTTGASEAWMRPPFAARLAFVPVEVLRYLELTFWPSGLAVLYPAPGTSLGAGEVVLALAVVTALTALAVAQRHARPWLLAGWAWFGVTLLPVLGIVHVGFQGIADRYTYVPSLGLSAAVAFAAREAAERLGLPGMARAGVAALVLFALGFATHRQVEYWHDGMTLYERALAVTRDNFVIHEFYANELADAGRRADAYGHYRESLRIRPDFPHGHYALGVMYEEEGRNGEAMAEYREALRINPDFVSAHFNLANLLGQGGQLDEAVSHYQRVLELEPDHRGARQGLALAKQLQGR